MVFVPIKISLTKNSALLLIPLPSRSREKLKNTMVSLTVHVQNSEVNKTTIKGKFQPMGPDRWKS